MSQTCIEESGEIKSARDLMKLEIIDWNRLIGYWKNIPEAAESLASWLIESESQYSIIKCRMDDAPERDDWPGWKHIGHHPEIGQVFWNWFHYHQKGEIHFSDSPDFFGKLRLGDWPERTFFGDIGLVSAPTFSRTIRALRAHDVWITVVDTETQIMIEPMYSISQLADDWSNYIFGPYRTATQLRMF